MEQNRSPLTDFSSWVPRQFNGKIILTADGIGTTGYPCTKGERERERERKRQRGREYLNHYLKQYSQLNLKWIINLTRRAKSVKL